MREQRKVFGGRLGRADDAIEIQRRSWVIGTGIEREI
jgi:hypothetical protein